MWITVHFQVLGKYYFCHGINWKDEAQRKHAQKVIFMHSPKKYTILSQN